MTWQSHAWFRYGWYRSISLTNPVEKWAKRMNRLIESGNRARRMNIQHNRIEIGGLEEPYIHRGDGI